MPRPETGGGMAVLTTRGRGFFDHVAPLPGVALTRALSRLAAVSRHRQNHDYRGTPGDTQMGDAADTGGAKPALDHTRRLGSLDRLFRPVERAENRPLDQCAPAVINRGERLRVHDAIGKLSRCQWSGSIAQNVVDQAQTLTRTEPGIVGSRLSGSDLRTRPC